MIKYDFSGRVVVVAGGTRGIGGEISRQFVQAGAQVYGLFGGNATAAQAFVDSLGGLAGRFTPVQCNVADYQAVEDFFTGFDAKHGALDILVNSAGIRRDGVLAMLAEDKWSSVIDTNLGGTYNLFKQGVQRMLRKRYGRLIAISSVAGHLGIEGQTNYSASKAGQMALAKAMAKEVGKRGITVNCVAPGFIETDFIAELPEEQRAAYKASVPARRFGTPSEVAALVLFLASEEAAYINGATLDVSGGL